MLLTKIPKRGFWCFYSKVIFENNLLINLSKEARVRPDRIKPACPITPVSLNVGIIIDFEKNFLNIVFLIKS